MTSRRVLRAIAYVAVNVALDLLDAAAYFVAVALVTVPLSLVLPLGVAVAIALVGVSIAFGYRRARAIERARMRGELR
jgi:hypothetical protein